MIGSTTSTLKPPLELFGVLCSLCGNANHSYSHGLIASNGTGVTQTEDFTLLWLVNNDAGSCIEACNDASCPVCTQCKTISFSSMKASSFMTGCTLLWRSDGPFVDCHSYIDPEPFVGSCVSNLCISEAAPSYWPIPTSARGLGSECKTGEPSPSVVCFLKVMFSAKNSFHSNNTSFQ